MPNIKYSIDGSHDQLHEPISLETIFLREGLVAEVRGEPGGFESRMHQLALAVIPVYFYTDIQRAESVARGIWGLLSKNDPNSSV